MTAQTRTKDGILHFLTREQMADEIVRLDAALAARATAAPQEGVSVPPGYALQRRATELHEKASMPWGQAVELALSEQGISLPLYQAINKLVCQIGCDGSIDSDHALVTEVMDALHDLDGGSMFATAFQPPASALPLAVKTVDQLNPMALRNAVLDLVTAAQTAALSSAQCDILVHGKATRLLTEGAAINLAAKAADAETAIREYVTAHYAAPPPLSPPDTGDKLQDLADLSHELGLESVPAGVQGDAARLIGLLREARATLEMWKDVAPAVSLCKDLDAAIQASEKGGAA